MTVIARYGRNDMHCIQQPPPTHIRGRPRIVLKFRRMEMVNGQWSMVNAVRSNVTTDSI